MKPKLKLIGTDGNAWAVMGAVAAAGRKAGWPKSKIDEIILEMMSGDYDHLLQTAMNHFEVS